LISRSKRSAEALCQILGEHLDHDLAAESHLFGQEHA
jgi:hypothetical protein